VYINNIKQNVEVAPNSYINLDREWKNKDEIRLVFRYDFYLKSMPDDNNVIAIFYGSTRLAFDYASELIMNGNQAEFLLNLSVSPDGKTFSLTNGGKVYSLKPLYELKTRRTECMRQSGTIK